MMSGGADPASRQVNATSVYQTRNSYGASVRRTSHSPDNQNTILTVDETMVQDKETQMLDLINRVQMFQIASAKVNQNLMSRKKEPVFNLQFNETFEENPKQSEIDMLDKVEGVSQV